MIALQRTDEWKAARLGHVTASRFGDVMTDSRGKNGQLSKTAESLLLDLIGEHLSGSAANDFENHAMRWGTEHEPEARDAYAFHTGSHVDQVGFEVHRTEEYIGCSPDGLVEDDGLIECKCPFTVREHVRVLVSGQMPDEHKPQVQGQLWITGREWCDFVSYHPRVRHNNRLVVVRVERDEKYIEELATKVVRLRDLMLGVLDDIAERTGMRWRCGAGTIVGDKA